MPDRSDYDAVTRAALEGLDRLAVKALSTPIPMTRRRNTVYAGTSRAQLAALVANTPEPKPGDRAKLYGR